jgi:YtoQ family protein
MNDANWAVYLSGEIHTDWRDQIIEGAKAKNLPVEFLSPVTVHEDSDDCGAVILGEEPTPFWRDHKGAKINAIRTRTLIQRADIVVVRFAEKYRQWNAAFDAGFAAAMDTPLITLRDDTLTHAMKEVDAAALATATEPAQVVKLLEYVITGQLPR